MTRAANVASSTVPSWTTATRPASPTAGQMGFNTTTGSFEYYNGTNWFAVTATNTALYDVSYLVVGGGGGGGGS